MGMSMHSSFTDVHIHGSPQTFSLENLMRLRKLLTSSAVSLATD